MAKASLVRSFLIFAFIFISFVVICNWLVWQNDTFSNYFSNPESKTIHRFPPLDQAALSKADKQLAELPVKGKAPKTGYSREQFGAAWADVDHNGCDTRNDILARDLNDPVFKKGTQKCVVLSGKLIDPYTGKTIDFKRGAETSAVIQIDHIVALNNAWQTGAQQLSAEARTQLANDPANLLAVDGATNQQKGASDAASWLPPNPTYRCTYVVQQIAVKSKYHLWVTKSEQQALKQILKSC